MSDKKCGGSCGLLLPLSEFGLKKGGAQGVRGQCRKCTASAMAASRGETKKKPRPPKPQDVRFPVTRTRREEVRKARRVVLTCALNNTEVDQDVWASLQVYAKARKAKIVVMPVRYKNPTSQVDGRVFDEGAWWPDELLPYMVDELLEIHPEFWAMAHVRVQATAVTPLTGLDTLSKGASAAFAHPQLAMRMIPTPQNKLPKILYTTGCVSMRNYSDTKMGIRADHHHGMGALVVESDGPRFHVRPLVCDDDGSFYDVDTLYSPTGPTASTGALALVTGDEHAVFADPGCVAATYTDRDSITKVVQPETIVRHDVFDGYSISHHHAKNAVVRMAKHDSGHHLVAKELQLTVDHINHTTPDGCNNLVVSSNHHNHLLQWMNTETPFTEPWNAPTWLDLWSTLKPTIQMGPAGAVCGNPFALWCQDKMEHPTEFLSGSADRTIADICISYHGHDGANGSRGSINQFAKVGVKTIIAHSHTPGIKWGCWQVGVSAYLKLEYTKGLSSWIHGHCVIHPNGKRQLILVVDGRWRLK